MIKAVIFDLDGVLIDSKELHFEALNKALEALDPKFIITKEEHLTTYDGLPTKEKLNLLHKFKALPLCEFDRVWKAKQAATDGLLDHVTENSRLVQLFQELRRRGCQLGVASNAIGSTVRKILVRMGVHALLDCVISNDDVHNPKPSSEMYLRAMIKMRVDPINTLIVEDSPVGRQAARASGATLFAVKDSVSWTNEELFKALEEKKMTNATRWADKRLNVVIPMAGAGSRFEKAGYTFPKPLIEVRGKPMIQLVVENLGLDANYIFIVQHEHNKKYQLYPFLNLIAPGCKVVAIDGMTQGAACTVLKAREYINNDRPLVIANSDQFVEWNPTDFYYGMEADKKIDGGIVTFKATHPKWSFVKVNDGLITEVAEKRPISDDATVGIYYWKEGSAFVQSADEMIEEDNRVNGEFYVAPTFNYAINRGLKFKPFQITKMWGLGTPEDLTEYLAHH